MINSSITLLIQSFTHQDEVSLMNLMNDKPVLEYTLQLCSSIQQKGRAFTVCSYPEETAFLESRGLSPLTYNNSVSPKNPLNLIGSLLPQISMQHANIGDYVCVVNARFPFHRKNTIDLMIERMQEEQLGAMMAIVPSRQYPVHTLVESNGVVDFFTGKDFFDHVPRRQEMNRLYLSAGIFIMKTDLLPTLSTTFLNDGTIVGNLVDEYRGWKIRDEIDITFGETMFARGTIPNPLLEHANE